MHILEAYAHICTKYEVSMSNPVARKAVHIQQQVTNSIRMKANRPLRDRNPNTYNLIVERPQNDLDLEMTLTLR